MDFAPAEKRSRRIRDWPAWVQYGLSLGAVLAALAVRLSLDRVLQDRLPYVTIFIVLLPLVMLVRPGAFLAGALLGCVGAWFMFLPPRFTFRIDGPFIGLQVGLFLMGVLAAALTAWLAQRAERRERRADAMLRAFVDDAPACKWITAPDGRIVYVNQAMAQALGKPIDQIVGRTHGELLPPKRAKLAVEHIRAVRESGQARASFEEIEPLNATGPRRILEWRRFALKVEGDDHVLVAGMANDVSERTRLETAVARQLASAKRLASVSTRLIGSKGKSVPLQELVDAAIEITHADMGNIQLLEGDALKIVSSRGFDAHFLDYFNTVHGNHAACGTAMASGQRTIVEDVTTHPILVGTPELDVLLKAGVRAVQSTPLVTRDGKLVGMLSTHYGTPAQPSEDDLLLLDVLARQTADWLERTQAETTLRTAEERYRIALTGSSVAVWECDRDLRFTFVENSQPPVVDNAAILGKRDDEILPYDCVHEIIECKKRVLASGKGERREISVRFSEDDYYFDFVCEPMHGATGAVVGLRGVAVNISASKKLESALRRSEQVLRARDEERGYLLEAERAARTEAETQARMKDEFLASVSHELRTPLNAILGWAQLLTRTRIDEKLLAEGAAAIMNSARMQAQLIDDLLDMNRIMSGKLRLDVQAVEMARVVEEALATVRPGADAKGIRIRAMLDPAAGPIRGDPVRLQQVAWNLLGNAVKFTPKGGTMQVTLERSNSHVELTVTDTGIGIKRDFLPHVFERFRQADTSSTRQHGGLGLGLAIAKQIAELHGGSISATSEGEGTGATFRVRLPVAIARPESQSESETLRADIASDMQLTGLRILIVDDDAAACDVLERLLTSSAAQAECVHSGPEALEAIAARSPDVLLCDLGMPGMDGYEVIRRVRADGARFPAIAITAFARTEDRIRALQAGFNMHLSKPVDARELLTVINTLLQKSLGA